MHWQTLGVDASLFRSWGNETVLFHQPSGQLHILEKYAVEVLLTLQKKPSSAQTLAIELSAKWQCELTSQFKAEIEAVLQNMQTLSLVDCS